MSIKARSYLLGEDGPAALVPGRIARILERTFPDLNKLRIAARGKDLEAYLVLESLHRAALAYRITATGIAEEPEPESARRSSWMNSKQAAEYLHLGERAIRVACEQRRIPAEKIDGRWRIATIDLEDYKAQHARKE